MTKKIVIRVRMEPELEQIAGHLGPAARLEMAAKLARWTHQLKISAAILSEPPPLRRPMRLRALDSLRLVRN